MRRIAIVFWVCLYGCDQPTSHAPQPVVTVIREKAPLPRIASDLTDDDRLQIQATAKSIAKELLSKNTETALPEPEVKLTEETADALTYEVKRTGKTRHVTRADGSREVSSYGGWSAIVVYNVATDRYTVAEAYSGSRKVR